MSLRTIAKNSALALLSVTIVFVASSNCIAGPQLTTAEIHEDVSQALVLIETDRGAGSGFLIDSSGSIATALHVVTDAERVKIQTSTGDIFDVVLLMAEDKRRDIAIIKVAGFDLPYVDLGNSNDLNPGDELVVVGNPLGLEDLVASVTKGVVSGIRDLGDGFRTIQTDAAISQGHSGSPVLSKSGKVVGIVSFRITGGESLNFAIPINYLRGLQGIQASAPLKTWSQPLSDSSLGSVSAKKSTDQELSGTWRSLETSWLYDVQQDNDRMYILSNPLNAPGVSLNFDLVSQGWSQGKAYNGTVSYRAPCNCITCGAGSIFFATERAELIVDSESRLEVRWQIPTEGGNNFAAKIDCRGGRFKEGPRAWINRQVWIRK